MRDGLLCSVVRLKVAGNRFFLAITVSLTAVVMSSATSLFFSVVSLLFEGIAPYIFFHDRFDIVCETLQLWRETCDIRV